MEPYAQAPVHLYQIAYNAATREALEPGYHMLDNLANERPDWYEYWPIRRFLLDAEQGRADPLDETAWYGFFSPKFGSKTQLSHDQVQAYVRRQDAQADVVLFSPQPDMGAFFLNVFEQGETFDPGLIAAYEALLAHVGRPVQLSHLVMDSRQVVFSNYFVARPAFWREWLALNEALFAACEDADGPLQATLTHETSYPGPGGHGAQRKVFLMERAASLLLATQPRWRSVAHNPFGMGWSMSRLREFPREAFISDALKVAFRAQGFPEYMQAYAALRSQFLSGRT
ncbi:MAG: hypothetical protein HUU30_12685 [Burkholderiaceae bacterium]|jgi:hypothetical protein|nr:hypothetical protein [Aquabacterium sp.]NUP86591.1 hypothetical protein [Burkholderiaceae bacterium]